MVRLGFLTALFQRTRFAGPLLAAAMAFAAIPAVQAAGFRAEAAISLRAAEDGRQAILDKRGSFEFRAEPKAQASVRSAAAPPSDGALTVFYAAGSLPPIAADTQSLAFDRAPNNGRLAYARPDPTGPPRR